MSERDSILSTNTKSVYPRREKLVGKIPIYPTNSLHMWLMSNEDADIEQQIKDLEEEASKEVEGDTKTNPKESKEKDEAKEETYWQ